jgi:hypothetical protein
MKLKSTPIARIFSTCVSALVLFGTAQASAQQGPMRSKSQSMLVTATVERSCDIVWLRQAATLTKSDVKLCEQPQAKKDSQSEVSNRPLPAVSYTLTLTDQQTRLDF